MRSFDELISGLSSEDSFIRREAIEGLAEEGDTECISSLVPLLRDPNPSIRDSVVDALLQMEGSSVAERLVPYLYEEDVPLRNAAIEVLEKLGDDSFVPLLPILGSDDEDVLKFAIDIVSSADRIPPAIVRELLSLVTHKNPNIRASAAIALSGDAGDDVVLCLVKALSDEEDEWVRFSIMEALGQIGCKDVIGKFISSLGEDDVTRAGALDALSFLAGPDDYEEIMPYLEDGNMISLLDTSAVVRLIGHFIDNISEHHNNLFHKRLGSGFDKADNSERQEIIRGIKLLRNEDAVPLLLSFLGKIDRTEEEIVAMLVDAIVDAGNPAPVLHELKGIAVSGGEDEVASLMVDILSRIGDVSVMEECVRLFPCLGRDQKLGVLEMALHHPGSIPVGTLKGLLKDSDGHVRGLAARLLGESGDISIIPDMISLMEKEEFEDVRGEIASALASFGTVEIEQLFASSIKGGTIPVKIASIKGLAAISNEFGRSVLNEAVHDRDAEVRKEAIKVLASCDNGLSKELVLSILDDSDKGVRMAVIEAIEGKKEFEDAILKVLEDPDMWVRFKAAKALQSGVSGRGELALLRHLEDDILPVQIASAESLSVCGSVSAINALERFTDHSDPDLRLMAERAIESIEGRA